MLLDIYHCGGVLGREFGLFVVYVEGSGPTELNYLYSRRLHTRRVFTVGNSNTNKSGIQSSFLGALRLVRYMLHPVHHGDGGASCPDISLSI